MNTIKANRILAIASAIILATAQAFPLGDEKGSSEEDLFSIFKSADGINLSDVIHNVIQLISSENPLKTAIIKIYSKLSGDDAHTSDADLDTPEETKQEVITEAPEVAEPEENQQNGKNWEIFDVTPLEDSPLQHDSDFRMTADREDNDIGDGQVDEFSSSIDPKLYNTYFQNFEQEDPQWL